jgi:hypothetical protein
MFYSCISKNIKSYVADYVPKTNLFPWNSKTSLQQIFEPKKTIEVDSRIQSQKVAENRIEEDSKNGLNLYRMFVGFQN